jgi:hypothetical protein
MFDLNSEAKMARAQNGSDRATTLGDFLSQSIRMTFSVHTAYRKLTRGDIGGVGLRALCREEIRDERY